MNFGDFKNSSNFIRAKFSRISCTERLWNVPNTLMKAELGDKQMRQDVSSIVAILIDEIEFLEGEKIINKNKYELGRFLNGWDCVNLERLQILDMNGQINVQLKSQAE